MLGYNERKWQMYWKSPKSSGPIILGPDFNDYQSRLLQLGLERLDLRRANLRR